MKGGGVVNINLNHVKFLLHSFRQILNQMDSLNFHSKVFTNYWPLHQTFKVTVNLIFA